MNACFVGVCGLKKATTPKDPIDLEAIQTRCIQMHLPTSALLTPPSPKCGKVSQLVTGTQIFSSHNKKKL